MFVCVFTWSHKHCFWCPASLWTEVQHHGKMARRRWHHPDERSGGHRADRPWSGTGAVSGWCGPWRSRKWVHLVVVRNEQREEKLMISRRRSTRLKKWTETAKHIDETSRYCNHCNLSTQFCLRFVNCVFSQVHPPMPWSRCLHNGNRGAGGRWTRPWACKAAVHWLNLWTVEWWHKSWARIAWRWMQLSDGGDHTMSQA